MEKTNNQEQEHDCSNCDKMPALLKVMELEQGRTYMGIMQTSGKNIFCRLRFDETIDDLSKRLEENPEHSYEVSSRIHLDVKDAEGKDRTLDEYTEKIIFDFIFSTTIEYYFSRPATAMRKSPLGSAEGRTMLEKLGIEVRSVVETATCLPKYKCLTYFLASCPKEEEESIE